MPSFFQVAIVGCATPSAAAAFSWVPPKNRMTSSMSMPGLSAYQYPAVNRVSAENCEVKLGTRVRGLRKALGLTQVQLSRLAGITQGSLSSIENGDTKELRAETILALAKHLGTSPDWIRTGAGPPTEPERPTPDEAEALHLFRALPAERREEWLRHGRFLLSESASKPARAIPFAKHR